jgi:hypothetical protein
MNPTNRHYCVAVFMSFLIMISIAGLVASMILYNYAMVLVNFLLSMFFISLVLVELMKLSKEIEEKERGKG